MARAAAEITAVMISRGLQVTLSIIISGDGGAWCQGEGHGAGPHGLGAELWEHRSSPLKVPTPPPQPPSQTVQADYEASLMEEQTAGYANFALSSEWKK